MKKTLITLAALTVLAMLALGCGGDDSSADKSQTDRARTADQGSSSPNAVPTEEITFTLRDSEGNVHNAGEWIGQQPVVLNFWGSWCGYCRKETPDLVKLYDEYKAKGVEILGMTINDTPAKANAFAEQYNMTWPLLMADNSIAAMFGIRGAPTTIFLDAEGNVVQVEDYNGTMVNRFTGARDYETLKRGFEAVLRQSASS